ELSLATAVPLADEDLGRGDRVGGGVGDDGTVLRRGEARYLAFTGEELHRLAAAVARHPMHHQVALILGEEVQETPVRRPRCADAAEERLAGAVQTGREAGRGAAGDGNGEQPRVAH